MPNGRPVKAWTGGWSLNVERRIPGDIDAQIAEVLAPLTTDLSIWRDLASRFEVDIFIGAFIHESNQYMVLSPATTKAVGDRGILLDFDVYSQVPEEGEAVAEDPAGDGETD